MRRLALVAWFVAGLSAKALAAEPPLLFYVLPDSLSIDTADGLPMVNVTEVDGGFTVGLVFRADYSHVRAHILQEHNRDLDRLEIVELPVAITAFDFIGTFLTDNRAVVRTVSREYLGSELRLQVDLSTDLRREQVLDLFRFNVVYGISGVNVVCPDPSAHRLCGGKVTSLPVNNQYKLGNTPGSAPAEYLELSDYRNTLLLGNGPAIYTRGGLNYAAREDLLTGGQCRGDLDPWRARICGVLLRQDPEGTLTAAIEHLAVLVFPKDILGRADFSQYIEEAGSPEPVKIRDAFLYLRCTMTSWRGLSEKALLKPTTTDGPILTLEIDASQPWMTQGGDDCTITGAGAKGQWVGINNYVVTTHGKLGASQDYPVANSQALQTFTVVLPHVGKYLARLDRMAGTLSFIPE